MALAAAPRLSLPTRPRNYTAAPPGFGLPSPTAPAPVRGLQTSTRPVNHVANSFAPPDQVVGNSGYDGQYATPAAPPAPPAVPGGLDYTTILQDDPLLKQTLAGLNASGVQNQAALLAAQQRALIQYGNVPAGLTAPGLGAVDQTTRDLAQQNTAAGLSTYAKLGQAHTLADQASVASEAARGLLHSGAYGQHAAENLLNYNQGQDTATQQLLDYLNGIYSGYLGQQQTLQGSAASAQSDALTRLIQQIQAGLITGGAASTPTVPAPTPASPPVTPVQSTRPGWKAWQLANAPSAAAALRLANQ